MLGIDLVVLVLLIHGGIMLPKGTRAMPAWPTSFDYSEYARDKIFALGLISSRFNALERVFFEKFATYLQQGPKIAAEIFARLSTDKHILLLRLMIEKIGIDDDIVENEYWFLRGYKTCNTNRNALMHS